VPTYFAAYRQYAEAATSDGGDGDDDQVVDDEGPQPSTVTNPLADDTPTTLEVLAAARGLDAEVADAQGAPDGIPVAVEPSGDGQAPGQEPHKKNGKPHRQGKVRN
jgi:hypothetical protein